MNDRERFIATMHYQPRDRCPWGEMGFWPETLAAWHEQGWPEDEHLHTFLGFDRLREQVDVSLGLLPGFKSAVLEETRRTASCGRDGVWRKELRANIRTGCPKA
jgi:hypothetical protein